MELKRAVIIPDCHIPFECHDSFSLLLKVIKLFRPHEVVILGDFLDCYAASQYEKDPRMGDVGHFLAREFECANIRLDQIDKAAGNAKKIYLEGNHEFRIEKMLLGQSKAFHGLIDLTRLLNLDKRPRWSFVPYTFDQAYQVLKSPLWARHNPVVGGSEQNSAKQAGDSYIHGHDHQINEGSFVTRLSKKKVISISSGWLGDAKKNRSVFDYVKAFPSWAKAFTLVWANEKEFIHDTVRIMEGGKCLYQGKLISV